MLDAEADALWLYQQAGIDPEQPEGTVALARALGFRVERHAGLKRTAALVARQGVLYLSTRAAPAGVGFAVGHELAEHHLEQVRYHADDAEDVADHLAGALVAPRPAFHLWIAEVGRSLPDLARAFATTQSIVALRLGEVTGSPLALVTPRRVHVRGEAFGWGSEREVRLIARGAVPETIERIVVTDARARWVLRAA